MASPYVAVNTRLSKHLDYSEVRCRCSGMQRRCTGGQLQIYTAALFESLRKAVCDYAGMDIPLIVTSGLRCPSWNAYVGGSPTSKHITGEALDVLCPTKMNWIEFAIIANTVGENGGVGFYPHWKPNGGVHIDVCASPSHRRWHQDKQGKIKRGTHPEVEKQCGAWTFYGPGLV